MSELLNRLIESIPGTDTSTASPLPISEDYHQKVEELSDSELEELFSETNHEIRLTYIKRRGLSPKKWREFTSYIQTTDKLQTKWGKKGKHEDSGKCIEHSTSLTVKTIYDQSEYSRADSRISGTTLGSGFNTGVKMEVGSEETKETQESETSMTGDCKEILECATGDKNCTLNRRAFINAGDFWMVSGLPQEELFNIFSESVR